MDKRMDECISELLDGDQLETLTFALSEHEVSLRGRMREACEALASEKEDDKVEWMLTSLGRDALEAWRVKRLFYLINEMMARLNDEEG